MIKYKKGDVVFKKETGEKDVVVSVPGMRYYDSFNFLDAKEGFTLEHNSWDRTEYWSKEEPQTKIRKNFPVYSGVLKYFPDAIREVAYVSKIGNDQHNPGTEMHWDKSKSTDEPDALIRHLIDHAKGEVYDTDGIRHLSKVAWRALAYLQRELENEINNIPGK